jgi:dimethylglycine dehydrogenase
VIETEDRDAHGFEPVRSGREIIGYAAAGGYGPVVQQSIALAYLPTDFLVPGTELTVELGGEELKATVVEQPLYDPENEKLLS